MGADIGLLPLQIDPLESGVDTFLSDPCCTIGGNFDLEGKPERHLGFSSLYGDELTNSGGVFGMIIVGLFSDKMRW